MERNTLIYKIFGGLSLLILILPLLNLPSFFSPPEWGKSIMFRVLFSLALMLFLLLMLGQSRFQLIERIKQKISTAKVAFFLMAGLFLAFFLASIFSSDPNFSFWGDPVRGGGSATFLLLIVASFFAFVFFSTKNWKYAWGVTLTTAFLVSVVAIFQWQGWFSKIIVSQQTRPSSTMGNDIQLGIYLIILLFPVLVFFLREKMGTKKILYLLAFLLFSFIILLTGSRGAYLGVLFGFSYFVLLYPLKKLSHSLILKFAFLGLMIIPAFFVYYANTHTVFPQFIQNNTTLYTIAGRLQLRQFIEEEPRFSTWKVGLKAIQARPFLGYGPENFSIAFDKHYDPNLPNIQYVPDSSNSWWDKAHNVFVDIAVQAGIPALLLYLAFFGTLFWRLQKIKNENSKLLSHGLQATLIAYFGSLLFGFDHFSTMLVFFFLAAYILHVTNKEPEILGKLPLAKSLKNSIKVPIIITASFFILVFVWQYNILPLQVNAKINDAENLVEIEACDQALEKMDSALMQNDTFFNAYINFKYAHIFNTCGQINLEKAPEYNQKSYELLKESIETRPTYTRAWIFLATSINIMLEQVNIGILPNLSPERIESLKQEMEEAFLKANELSPKRQEVYIEWIRADLVAGNFQVAKERSQKCISLDPDTGTCWWLKGLSEIFLNEPELAESDIAKSAELSHLRNSESSLKQLIRAYVTIQNYTELAKVTEQLVAIDPYDPKYHAALAATYKELGEYAKARKEAAMVLILQPEAKADIEAFLRTIGY